VFDTKLYDTNNNFASGTYTAPVAGFYHFDANAVASVTTANFQILVLYKNGSGFHGGSRTVANTTNLHGQHLSCLVQLAANDTVDIRSLGTGGAGSTGQINTYFNGFLVSRT